MWILHGHSIVRVLGNPFRIKQELVDGIIREFPGSLQQEIIEYGKVRDLSRNRVLRALKNRQGMLRLSILGIVRVLPLLRRFVLMTVLGILPALFVLGLAHRETPSISSQA
jgi:hypothetical protein